VWETDRNQHGSEVVWGLKRPAACLAFAADQLSGNAAENNTG